MRTPPSAGVAARTALTALTLCTVCLPGLAQAKDDDDTEKAEKPSKVAASIEFLLGMGTSLERDADKGDTVESDGKLTLGIVPGFDKMLGPNFGVGGEYMFVWGGSDEKDAPDERSLIMSPHLRFRMAFPLWKGLTFDGLFGIGPSLWVGNDKVPKVDGGGDGDEMRDTRFGWSLRFNFGAGWKFNESVAAFTALGYYTTTTYGDEVALNLNTVPLSLGLRSQF